MFEPKRKNHWYILLVLGVAITIGWSIHKQYKPLIISTNCSEVAAKSSDLLIQGNLGPDDEYSYRNIKKKCLQEAGVN